MRNGGVQAAFVRVNTEDLSDRPFEWRPYEQEADRGKMWGHCTSGKNSKCKGPEAELSVTYSNIRKIS